MLSPTKYFTISISCFNPVEQAPKKDSFAEKLATNVIKNLQVKVSDIHIRYEDKTTNPGSPIAIGATLHNLSLGVRFMILCFTI